METKKCACCGRELPLSEFHKCGHTADGLHAKCKECRRKQSAEYYARKKAEKKAAEQTTINDVADTVDAKLKAERAKANAEIVKNFLSGAKQTKPGCASTTPDPTPRKTLEVYTNHDLIDELVKRGANVMINPSPRTCMEFLASKGYRGKLEYTEVKVIDINNF